MSNEDESFNLEYEQQVAARTIDRNVTLRAGAGSGKTTTLTERYLTILRAHLDGPAHLRTEREPDEAPYRLPDDITPITEPDEARRLPERIVVTTFTERAAEDLKQSIRAKIRERLENIEEPDQWELWRAAADGVEASYIHTVHGFCNRLLEEYAVTHPDIDPQFDVLEEGESTLLISEVVTEFIETEPPETQTLAPLFDRRKLVSVISDLISERHMTTQWLAEMDSFADETEYEEFLVNVHPFHADPETLLPELQQDVKTLCDLLDSADVREGLGSRSMKRVGTELQQWADGVADVPHERFTPFEQLSLCIDLSDRLTNGDNEAYGNGTYYGKKGFREGDSDLAVAYADAIAALLDTLDPAERPIDAAIQPDRDAYEYLIALASLTEKALEQFRRRKQRQGVLDYDDLIEQTHTFLESDSQAVKQLRTDIEYVMVDEFQDTNERQWQLVQNLVSSPDAFTANNVFIVGDTKQSIYRFRDADVTVFNTAEQALDKANDRYATPDDGPPLTTNFRTLPEPLDSINGLFEQIFGFGDDEPFEAAAEPLKPGRDAETSVNSTVEYVPVPVDDTLRNQLLKLGHDLHSLPESEPATIEATAIAARIVKLIEQKEVEPEDIAVLIRSRSALKEYERALRSVSLPYTVVKGGGFFETSEIRALVSLLKTLVNPGDEVALYAALRSPLLGLADETIAEAHEQNTSLWESIQNAATETRTAAEDIQRWREYAGTNEETTGPRLDSWVELFDKIVEESGYIASVAADERGSAAVANVDKFREKLREFDTDGLPSLERVVTRLTAQAEQGRAEAEANVAESGNGVRIMTIHEAKGQDYPVVVVPGLSKGFNNRARISNGSVEFEIVPLEGKRQPILGLNVPGEWGEDAKGTLLRHIAKERRQAEEHAEEKRILYVACTRAEDHLILTGQHSADEEEPTGVEPPDPDDPSSMRDWVQPTVFGTEETAVDSWNQLTVNGTFRRQLDYTLNGEKKYGEIVVRLPPEPTEYDGERETIEPETQRSHFEYEQPWEISVPASGLSSLEDGTAKLTTDEAERVIRLEDSDNDVEFGGGGTGSDMPASVFGEAVHRLCEVQPPRSQWEAFIEQVIDEQDSDGDDSLESALATDFTPIISAAERSVAFLDSLHQELNVVATFDEHPIELSIPNGTVRGYIDHLVVAPSAYHVVDYKTNRRYDDESVSEFLERQRTHHEPQVFAYAAALKQADPRRDVSVSLFFTDVNESYVWRSQEMTGVSQRIEEIIQRHLPDSVVID